MERSLHMTTKRETLCYLMGSCNRDQVFVANIILTHNDGKAEYLHGLRRLIEAGHEVRTGQFSTDILQIDGERAPWEALSYNAKEYRGPGKCKHCGQTIPYWALECLKC